MRDIPGYEGLYAVTSCGKVWSYRSQKFLKPELTKKGYLRVSLGTNGKYKHYKVHRLVAQAYIPNPLGLPQVNHKSEVKTENFVNNLEWCDNEYNCNYGTRNERVRKATRKPIYCVELDRVFESGAKAAEELNLYQSNISSCCTGKLKTTGGYHFRYAEAANE